MGAAAPMGPAIMGASYGRDELQLRVDLGLAASANGTRLSRVRLPSPASLSGHAERAMTRPRLACAVRGCYKSITASTMQEPAHG